MDQSREAHYSAKPLTPTEVTPVSVPREPASEAGGRAGVCPDCYDDPHRRNLTAAPTPRSASLPRSLLQSSQ
jgi:hypothetical protein